MKVAIIGSLDSGKDDLFSILSEGKVSKVGAELVGVVNVPDERVDKLSEFFKPKKTTFAQINFISPEFGKTLPIEELRTADEIVYVVKCYGAFKGEEIDPIKTLSDLDLVIRLNDLEIIERYITKHEKDSKAEREVKLLKEIKKAIEENSEIDDEKILKDAILRGFSLISIKPKLVVLNVSEEMIGKDGLMNNFKKNFSNYKFIDICVSIEKELLSLDLRERSEIFEAYGIVESGLKVFIKSSYELLNLITFFTVGSDEVKAWTLNKGSTVYEAAGKIHSDIQKGFIRAEVINYEEFLPLQFSFKDAKEKGLLRLEGKDYIVRDGDVVHIRFNV